MNTSSAPAASTPSTPDAPIVSASSVLQALLTGSLPTSSAAATGAMRVSAASGLTAATTGSPASISSAGLLRGATVDTPPASLGLPSSGSGLPLRGNANAAVPLSTAASRMDAWDAATREGLARMEVWAQRVPHASHRPRMLRLVRALHHQVRAYRGESQTVVTDGRVQLAVSAVRRAMLDPNARYRDVVEAGVLAMDEVTAHAHATTAASAVPPRPSLDAARMILSSQFTEEQEQRQQEEEEEDGSSTSTLSMSSTATSASATTTLSIQSPLSSESEDSDSDSDMESEVDTEVGENVHPMDLRAHLERDLYPADVPVLMAPPMFSRCPSAHCMVRQVEMDVAHRLRGLAERVERGDVTWDSRVMNPRDAAACVVTMMRDLSHLQQRHRPWTEATRQVVMNTQWRIANPERMPYPLRMEYLRRSQGGTQGLTLTYNARGADATNQLLVTPRPLPLQEVSGDEETVVHGE